MEKLPWQKIQINQESGLTDLQLKQNPPVKGTESNARVETNT